MRLFLARFRSARSLASTILAMTVVVWAAPTASAQSKPEPSQPKRGLIVNDPKACPGYTLLAPSNSHTAPGAVRDSAWPPGLVRSCRRFFKTP